MKQSKVLVALAVLTPLYAVPSGAFAATAHNEENATQTTNTNTTSNTLGSMRHTATHHMRTRMKHRRHAM